MKKGFGINYGFWDDDYDHFSKTLSKFSSYNFNDRLLLEIEQFKHKEFNFQTSGKDVFDMRFGETFFLENDDLISDTDDTTAGQTTKKKIKLVAKRIEYHLTKPIAGTGGLTRSIKGIKRFS